MQQPQQPSAEQHQRSVPSLALNDISLSLSSPHQLVLSPVPRVPIPGKRVTRKPSRPSTASSAIESRPNLLPTTPNSGSYSESSSPISSPRADLVPSWPSSRASDGNGRSVSKEKMKMQDAQFNPREVIDLLDEDQNRSVLDCLPSVFDPSPPVDNHLSIPFRMQESKDIVDPGYDWAAFVSAYASGKWDPHKTPHPPRSQFQHPTHSRNALSESISSGDSLQGVSGGSYLSLEATKTTPTVTFTEPWNTPEPKTAPPASPPTTKSARPTEIRLPKTDRSQSLNINSFSNRLRNSFADLRPSNSNFLGSDSDTSSSPRTAEIIATAATIRWAGARVSVAPLALPSPEHELTDPMRGVNTAIPGSHPPELTPERETGPQSPGRRIRLASFWEGTQYLDQNLPTIQGSPDAETQDQEPDSHTRDNSQTLSVEGTSTDIFYTPFTAPLTQAGDHGTEDYFGDVSSSRTSSYQSHGHPPLVRHESLELGALEEPVSVPALPRRIILTRQTSSPLPSMPLFDRPFRTVRATRSSSESSMLPPTRAVKEEQMFADLGYLVPPHPPNELERRRALYRFDHTQARREIQLTHLAGSTSGKLAPIPVSSGLLIL
jgi:hypothetical protein